MNKTLVAVAAAALSMLSTGALAAPVAQSQTQILTAVGQDMTFTFIGLPPAGAGGGTILIAPGAGQTPGLDLSGAFPLEDENFEVTFDGVSQGFFSCGGPSNNGSTAIAGAVDNSGNFNDCVFSLPFNLTGAQLGAFLADGSLSVGVLFGGDVSTFGDNDEVVVSLRYESGAVPEPGVLALVGLGLAGLGAARRRKA